MLRRGQHSRRWTYFDDATRVEDEQAICEACEQSGIVGDQDYGEAKVLPKGLEELQDFLLRCGIERRGRFIGNEQGRSAGDGLHNEHPLALAAAQLVGVGDRNARGVHGKHCCEKLVCLFA